jgi:hypothetical protein
MKKLRWFVLLALGVLSSARADIEFYNESYTATIGMWSIRRTLVHTTFWDWGTGQETQNYEITDAWCYTEFPPRTYATESDTEITESDWEKTTRTVETYWIDHTFIVDVSTPQENPLEVSPF